MPVSGKLEERKKILRNKKLWLIVLAVICLAILLAVGIYFAVTESSATPTTDKGQSSSGTPDSASKRYRYSAVQTDTNICSQIGTDVMGGRGGSAVDAVISTMLCVCLVNAQSCGIGGGHFATIYETPRNSSEKELRTLTAREKAPQAATEDMFVNNTRASTFGGLAVAVPGEIKGFHEAWLRYGRIPWRDLFAPSIKMCEQGFRVERDMARSIVLNENYIRNDTNLREIYVHDNGSLLKQGDLLINTKLANTLRRIAEDPNTFYHGSLADDIIADLQEYDGIMTRQDLESYSNSAATFIWSPPVSVVLRNGNVSLNSVPPPASGAVLHFILSILDGYNMTSKDIDNAEKKIQTYHRISEAFKFAYAKRSQLGDRFYVNVTELVSNLTSQRYAESIRHQIDELTTHDIPYYGPSFDYRPDSGTAHMNVLAPGGGAVALTGTINTRFGSKVRGRRTGIIFNNEMDDFSTPGTINAFGVPSSPSNYISPGKMPMSSIAPLIALRDNRVVLMSGAAGGTRITTSIAFITANNLWLGVDLKKATDQGRIHHQLAPNYVEHESWINKETLEGLKAKGHETFELATHNSVAGSLRSYCTDPDWPVLDLEHQYCIHAVSDGRKGGTPDGF